MNSAPLRQASASSPISLALTLNSGQVFHWQAQGTGFIGLVENVPLYAEEREEHLWTTPASADLACHYFALDHDLESIFQSLPQDQTMQSAVAACMGMRIIRQPLWECVATFIASALKQVPHIRQISNLLRTRYGEAVPYAEGTLYAFPTPAVIAQLSEAELRDCKLGFRAKNLLGAARRIASGETDLDAIRTFEDPAAIEELCKLPGVGPKVANCALLFAYGRLGAVPIDTWIARVLREVYLQKKRKLTPERMARFAADYFGPYAGYAQQCLFHHARTTWGRGQKPA